LQINLQRRDSSRCEHTGQYREASSCPVLSAGIVPEFEGVLVSSSTDRDALLGFTPHPKP
jgi:hypothetical protein